MEWNTIHGALEALFPNGTTYNVRGYERCPPYATSIFAAAAYLLERGGAYHRIVPVSDDPDSTNPGPSSWPSPNLIITQTDLIECRDIGAAWYKASLDARNAGEVVDDAALRDAEQRVERTLVQIHVIWGELIACHKDVVVQRPAPTEPLRWWLPALKLLIISDEYCRDLGYLCKNAAHSHPLERVIRDSLLLEGANHPRMTIEFAKNNPDHYFKDTYSTYAPLVNPHLVRVIPKSRTPGVGCTMRSLSHNLAIVPPEGVVDMHWQGEIHPFVEDREPLNLLLVPLPFHISASAFQPVGEQPAPGAEPSKWSWFKVDQTWLRRLPRSGEQARDHQKDAGEIAEFIIALVEKAEQDVGRVHGIVLPELALDWDCYAKLVERLQQLSVARHAKHKGVMAPVVEFLVSGLSRDPRRGSDGNFVATTTFLMRDEEHCIARSFCRAKHHRWQLNGQQITNYALGSSLDPNVLWWEANEVPRRMIDLTVFRRGAVFSAMICEDLARSEPCHEPLRSVGPNIVFVLLMDGPQTLERWPARYSTALADDPGSSVLTLTSLGLIERGNDTGHYPPTYDIGIWKDDGSKAVKIKCPKGAQGIVITLSGEQAVEATLDGRTNRDTQAWRYRGHQTVSLDPEKVRSESMRWILEAR